MYEVQRHYGYLTDEGLVEAAALVGLTPLELEELATFYDFIYREPVGRFVLHVCDGVVCWMFHEGSLFDYMCRKLGVVRRGGFRGRHGSPCCPPPASATATRPRPWWSTASFSASSPRSGSTRFWSN